jgi:chemotaxis protein MotB
MDVTQTASPDQELRGTNIGDHANPAGGAVSPEFVENASAEGLSNGGDGDSAMDGAAAMNAEGSEIGGETQNEQIAAGSMMEDSEALDPNSTHIGANSDAAPEQNPEHTADKERFAAMEAEIKQAMQSSPELAALQENIVFKETDEGFLVQIMDQDGKSMFASGKAKMNKATLELMQTLGAGLAKLPNDMVISGHTDAVPFANQAAYDNWDLSSDRANAMRRVLVQTGVTRDRITRVSGLADTQLLKEDAPKDPSNRRIEVLLAYEAANVPAGATPMHSETMAVPPAPTQQAASTEPAAAPVEVAKEETMVVETPEASVTKEILPAKPEPTVLDEKVFENLRSALR